ncbi:MAG: hypothetical protein ABI790_16440, partial [Betaproteobacteria bacterium]
IELAKSFGGTDGHKYVNGVLDKLAAQERAGEMATQAGKPASPRKPSASGRAPTIVTKTRRVTTVSTKPSTKT